MDPDIDSVQVTERTVPGYGVDRAGESHRVRWTDHA
jgi:hypothetical protein